MRLGIRRPNPVGASILALVLAGCVATPGATPSPTAPTGFQAVVVSTSTWKGDATVLVALSGREITPVSARRLVLSGRFSPPPGTSAVDPLDVDGSFVRPTGGSRDLVRFDVGLPAVGRWGLEVMIRDPLGSGPAAERRATTSLAVRDPGGVPTVGDPAPATATPTLAAVDGDVTLLTSDSHPLPAFYEQSVADALAAGSPFVLILDSAGFKESEACGSALSIFHGLAATTPDVTMIHAEPFRTRLTGSRLTLDPPNGPAVLAEWSVAWGLDDPAFGVTSVPWVFIVDRTGVVRATFQGVMGSEELAVALADVAF